MEKGGLVEKNNVARCLGIVLSAYLLSINNQALAQSEVFSEYDAGNGCRIRSVQSNQPVQFSWRGPCQAGYANGSGILVSNNQTAVMMQSGVFQDGYREGTWEYYGKLLREGKIMTFRMQFNRGKSTTGTAPLPGSGKAVSASELPAWAQVLGKSDFATAAMNPGSASLSSSVASPPVAAAPSYQPPSQASPGYTPGVQSGKLSAAECEAIKQRVPSRNLPDNHTCPGQRRWIDGKISLAREYLRGCGLPPPGENCRGEPPCISRLLSAITELEDHYSGGCGPRGDQELTALVAQLRSSPQGTSPTMAASSQSNARDQSSSTSAAASRQAGPSSTQGAPSQNFSRDLTALQMDSTRCIESRASKARDSSGVMKNSFGITNDCGYDVEVIYCFEGTRDDVHDCGRHGMSFGGRVAAGETKRLYGPSPHAWTRSHAFACRHAFNGRTYKPYIDAGNPPRNGRCMDSGRS
jgi:hypothetical protein